MYNLIKTASFAYAEATGNDPIAFAYTLAEKLGFKREDALKSVEKQFEEFKFKPKTEETNPLTQDFKKFKIRKKKDIEKEKKELQDKTDKQDREMIEQRVDKAKDMPITNPPKYAQIFESLSLSLKDAAPFLFSTDKDIEAVEELVAALDEGANSLRRAMKEDGTYYIKGEVVRDVLSAVRKTPARNKVDRDFRGPLSKGLFIDLDSVMDVQNKMKFDKEYSDQVFVPMTKFIKDLDFDKRLVRNKNKNVTEDKLQQDNLRKYQTRRASVASVIRKIANLLLNRED